MLKEANPVSIPGDAPVGPLVGSRCETMGDVMNVAEMFPWRPLVVVAQYLTS